MVSKQPKKNVDGDTCGVLSPRKREAEDEKTSPSKKRKREPLKALQNRAELATIHSPQLQEQSIKVFQHVFSKYPYLFFYLLNPTSYIIVE